MRRPCGGCTACSSETMRMLDSMMTLLHTLPELGAAPMTRHAAILAYLREVRHDRRISLDDAATALGVSPVELAGALWGHNDLSAQAVARLADLFAVDHALLAPLAAQPPRLALLDEAWLQDEDGAQPHAGWPLVVAKEGSA